MINELYKQLCESAINDGSPLAYAVKYELDKFFSQNACIPKGENRNPDADVLHEWIEGAEIEVSPDNWYWDKYPMFNSPMHFQNKYRIKPSDPVYECMYYDSDGKTDWLTEDEYQLMMETEPMECYKALETKRERKQ